MKNPLNDLPLNTKRVYVLGKCYTGCEVYMPVDSFVENIQQEKKNELQNWLNSQYVPPDAA